MDFLFVPTKSPDFQSTYIAKMTREKQKLHGDDLTKRVLFICGVVTFQLVYVFHPDVFFLGVSLLNVTHSLSVLLPNTVKMQNIWHTIIGL